MVAALGAYSTFVAKEAGMEMGIGMGINNNNNNNNGDVDVGFIERDVMRYHNH